MKKFSVKLLFALSFMLVAAVFNVAVAQEGHLSNVNEKNVTLDGYDPVSYFTEKEPIPGNQKYHATHNGATFYFSSDKNRKTFETDPQKYTPQYGGFCSMAMSMGRIEPVTISMYEIVDGKLYLQRNAKAAGMWKKMGAKMVIPKSDGNWVKAKARYSSFLTAAQLSINLDLSIEAAKAIAGAGLAYAKENKAPGGAIAIVDAGGDLLYLERMNETFPAAAMVAYEKARTAALFRFPSKKLEDAIIGGRGSLVTVGYNMLRGGLPIHFKGRVVGGVGVSGAASADQDVEIATAASMAKFHTDGEHSCDM